MSKVKVIITEEKLMEAVVSAINSLDANDFAKLAGNLIGGDCRWVSYPNSSDMMYEFIPDENYCGGLK